MKHHKILLAGLLAASSLAGCSALELDEEPRNFIAPENFFNTPEQIEAVLAACGARTYRAWGGYGYDPALHRHTDQDNGGDLIIPLNHGASVFELHYANIKDINFAIAALNNGNVQAGEEVLDQLTGQLKFLRAWNYFQLVRMWGDVPLLTEEHVDEYFSYQPPRAPVAEVYALIEADFQEAIEKLPESWSDQEEGRPAKGAARGLLAKTYLTMATAPLNDASFYQKAADLAREVIESGDYNLVEDIEDVFSMNAKYGPEMMWSFNANTSNPSTDPHIWSAIDGWGDYSADRFWVDSIYPEQPRKHAYLETFSRDGKPYQEFNQDYVGIKKFLYDTPENFDRGFAAVNIPVIRYADVLLIFAEAENMAKGMPTQEAVDAVNAVIDRANGYEENDAYPLLSTGMSKEEFDKAVIRERSFELCFEYDRWMDLIRKRILLEASREEIKPNFSEHIYLFPIPESEIRLNPNLEQNPGY